MTRLPGVRMVMAYRLGWLPKDLVAGLVLTTLLVPQGMAYAELAGLPPITGLYTTILSLAGYALLGPSRILVLGPDSSLGPMIAATILPLAGADHSPERAIALASMLALFVGGALVLAGVARLGFVADLLSKPIQMSYMTGLAVTIVAGQLPKLFGFSITSDTFIGDVRGFVAGLLNGETVGAALVVGALGLVVILTLQRFLPRLPAILLTVVLSIVLVVAFDLASHGVSLVGVLPKGLPPLTVPHVKATDLGPLVGGALGIALVSLTDTISTASAFATRSGDEIAPNQEMIGIGVANIASGFFQGFPVSTSGSRTAVAEQSGAKTQVTGLVGAGAITLMLVFIPGLLRNLPQPTLAAVVIAAAISLAEPRAMWALWHLRRTEFALSICAFLGVALLGVLPGIAIAVGLSILNVFRRAWMPYSTVLGRVPGMQGFHDLRLHPDGSPISSVVLYRFDAPLIFANARSFRDDLRAIASSDPPPKWIVIAAEPITDVDTTAAATLEALDQELNARGVSLAFAELKDPVREKVERYQLTRTIEPTHFFATLESAVEYSTDRQDRWEHEEVVSDERRRC